MKKNIFKSVFAVAAIAAVGLGSYKAYGSYTAANMSEEDLLLQENVLALSENTGTVRSLATNASQTIWCCCPGNVDNCSGNEDCEPKYGICR